MPVTAMPIAATVIIANPKHASTHLPFTADTIGMAMVCKPESVGRGNCETQARENGEDHMHPDRGHENSSAPCDIDGAVMLS